MAYRVYLIEELSDRTNHIELDVEDVDFGTVFNVAEVQDISQRKASMTKQIVFKGTQKNNNAFGSLFHLNKRTDFNFENKLFFNYNPLRTVDCIIEEDSHLILRGTLRVTGFTIKGGVTYYSTVVTSALIDLKEAIASKFLHDLDLSDLQHHWSWSVMTNSWAVNTERYNVNANTYTTVPFKKGEGYVYPFADHGERFPVEAYNAPEYVNSIHINNFRPAVYAKEYVKRIFEQDFLQGYTFEIKGSQETKDRFDSLIIPYNHEKMTAKNSNRNFKITKASANTHLPTNIDYVQNTHSYERPISMQNVTPVVPFLSHYGTYRGFNNAVFMIDRTFICDGLVKAKFASIKNNYSRPIKVHIQLRERDFVPEKWPDGADNSGFDVRDQNWTVIASGSISLNAGETKNNASLQFDVGEHEYVIGKQMMMTVAFEGNGLGAVGGLLGSQVTYNLTEVELYLPKSVTGVISYHVSHGDTINPITPENIKQMDFLKSLIAMFNFYVYAEPLRPKHLIFESHDDYYALTAANLLPTTAVDWTNKIDYSDGVEGKHNLTLPKKYLFTFKEDNDHFNKYHKDNFGRAYGDFTFNDEYGIIDQSKVEVIFSATPTIEYAATKRYHPGYYVLENRRPKPVKTNLRLLYYSGMKNCTAYEVLTDGYNKTTNKWEVSAIAGNVPNYACATEFYFRDGYDNIKPVDALHWGRPDFLFFGVNNDFVTVPTIYSTRYINQVSQLTDPNLVFIECQAFLNEIDIANLDLRVPVFIDMGDMGHAYFKVLSVSYENKNTTSTVKLQKITI